MLLVTIWKDRFLSIPSPNEIDGNISKEKIINHLLDINGRTYSYGRL
jgi:hypothetical protein